MDRKSLLQASKPILFSTQMVTAILEGRKTVTRRVVKFLNGKNPNWTGYIKDGLTLYNGTNEPCNKKPPCKKGDYLYVRETWSEWTGGYLYKAWISPFHQPGKSSIMRWYPSIHMPKEAARIFLKVTDVRMERLQNIMQDPLGPYNQVVREGCTYGCDFIAVWESTIKKEDKDKYGWEANPWVWVIEFERVEV